ncbi:MAG: hypothetical protein IJ115_08200 [Erysipelotrichaceae bacterium]|nr:hypothetical protein [Erysipelotrichaceae bacterium]
MAVKERKFVKASSGEAVKTTKSKTEEKVSYTKEARHERATGKRIIAIVFWVLAIACEVVFFLTLNKTIYIKNYQLYVQIGALVLDLIFVIIGSQFWKRANDVDPASDVNSVKFFLQNQMGLIVSILAFVPIVIVLLTNKDLDKKTKQVLVPVAAVALVLASLLSIDWNPISEEEYQATAQALKGETVYYTQFGKSYHLDPDCRALKNSSVVYEGTIEEALDAGRNDPCDFCVEQ